MIHRIHLILHLTGGEWCFTPLSTVFQAYHGNSSHYSCLSRDSPVLGWGSEVLAQGHSHEKPRGSSAPRTQDLWITSHFTTEQRRTPLTVGRYISPNVVPKVYMEKHRFSAALLRRLVFLDTVYISLSLFPQSFTHTKLVL